MNKILKRFGILLFALAANFNFLESVLSGKDFNSFYKENSLVAVLPGTIKTDTTSFEYQERRLGEGDWGISEEIFYEGQINANNDRVCFSVKTIFLKNCTMTRLFLVRVYKQNSEKPYFFTSVALENRNPSVDYYPGIFTSLDSDETLAFITNFFRNDFVDRISRCRELPIVKTEE